MKITTKIIIAMIVAIAVSLIICIVSNAEESDSAENVDLTSVGTEFDSAEDKEMDNAGAENITDEDLPSADGEKEQEQSRDETATDTEDAASGNVFEIFFNRVKEYSSELFCILTFICSVALAYAYKKGLLPFIQSTLLSFGTLLGGIKERTDKSEQLTKELGEGIITRVESAEAVLARLNDGLEKLSCALDEQRVDNEEREKFKTVMSAQIDMLYDIFMSSSLPQYQKEAVGERVMRMKEALGTNAVE